MKAKAKMKGPLEFEFDSESLTKEEAAKWCRQAENFIGLMRSSSKVSIKVEINEILDKPISTSEEKV